LLCNHMHLPFHLLQCNLLLTSSVSHFLLQQHYFFGEFLNLCLQTAVAVIDTPLVIKIIKNFHNAKNPITAKGNDDSELSQSRMVITTHHFAKNHKTKQT
jgi:hypothetical protein